MKTDKLIRMANQIAGFFRSYPEAEAVTGIRDHILAFWTPRMRESLLDHAEKGGAGLDPLVAKAMQAFREGRSPIEKEIAGPAEVGQMTSDAG